MLLAEPASSWDTSGEMTLPLGVNCWGSPLKSRPEVLAAVTIGRTPRRRRYACWRWAPRCRLSTGPAAQHCTPPPRSAERVLSISLLFCVDLHLMPESVHHTLQHLLTYVMSSPYAPSVSWTSMLHKRFALILLQAGNGVVVSALLATGAAAQIRLQDAAGDTPLVLAGRNGHAQVTTAQTCSRAFLFLTAGNRCVAQ